MNSISKLTIILSMLFLWGCSVNNKKISLNLPKLSPEHQRCVDTCEIMGMCAKLSGGASNKEQIDMCAKDCLETPRVLREAVASCVERVLIKECNTAEMSACVRRSVKR